MNRSGDLLVGGFVGLLSLIMANRVLAWAFPVQFEGFSFSLQTSPYAWRVILILFAAIGLNAVLHSTVINAQDYPLGMKLLLFALLFIGNGLVIIFLRRLT